MKNIKRASGRTARSGPVAQKQVALKHVALKQVALMHGALKQTKNQKGRQTDDTTEHGSTLVHYRRCHICGHVNEAHGAPGADGALVSRCDHCGKSLAPYYFFDEREVAPLSDQEGEPLWRLGDRKPVRGFSVYW